MDAFLDISYKLSESENFDEFMKALGVNLINRKIVNNSAPVIKLSKANGVYTLSTSTSFKSEEVSFKPDVEFDETTPDGKKFKTTVHIEGSKMTQTQKGDRVTIVVVREFSSDTMKATFTVGDIVSKRVYKKMD